MTSPDGTIQCLLCRGIVTFKEKDPIKFNLHMKNEHAVYFSVDILLAICLMDSEEQETVKNVVFDRMKKSDIDNVKDEKMDESIEGSDGDEDEDAVDISDEEEDLASLKETIKKEDTGESNYNPKSPFGCNICKKPFGSKKSLSHHRRRKHSRIRVAPEIDREFDLMNKVDLKESAYFRSQGHVVTEVGSVLEEVEKDFLEEDPKLPGWKIKCKPLSVASYTNGIRKKKSFLTPHKTRVINTSLGVLEYLRLQGKTPAQLKSLAYHFDVNKLSRLFNNFYDDKV